jgi:hypothetical protein
MSVSKVASRGEPKLCGISISTSRVELGKAVSCVQPGAHKRAKGNRFRGDTGENVKRVSGNNVREVRDYCNAVPGIRSLVRGCVSGRGGMRKSRGRVRT